MLRVRRIKSHQMEEYQQVRKWMEKQPLVQALERGWLSQYINSAKGKTIMREVAQRKELFHKYADLLSLPEILDLMAKWLSANGGAGRCCSDVLMHESGPLIVAEFAALKAGRRAALRLLRRPSTIRKIPEILKTIRDLEKRETGVQKNELPSFDFKSKEIDNLLKHIEENPDDLEAIFASFSENQKNTEICKMFIGDEQGRRLLFGYMTKNPQKTIRTFRELFEYEDRRKLCVQTFTSRSGTGLLRELAKDREGRIMITALSLTPHGIEIGLEMIKRRPASVLAVAWSYLMN